MRAQLLIAAVLLLALGGAAVTIEDMGHRRGLAEARTAAEQQLQQLEMARQQVELKLSRDVGRLVARNKELENAIAAVEAEPGGNNAGLPAGVVRALDAIR